MIVDDMDWLRQGKIFASWGCDGGFPSSNGKQDNIQKVDNLWGEETPIYRLEGTKMEGRDWFEMKG